MSTDNGRISVNLGAFLAIVSIAGTNHSSFTSKNTCKRHATSNIISHLSASYVDHECPQKYATLDIFTSSVNV